MTVSEMLENEDMQRIDWFTRSSDLNPMDYVWDTPRRCLIVRHQPPRSISEFRLTQKDERTAIPHQLIGNLVLSMDRRLKFWNELRFHHILYYRLDFSYPYHMDISVFCSVVLKSIISVMFLLYPLISLFECSVHFFHFLTTFLQYSFLTF